MLTLFGFVGEECKLLARNMFVDAGLMLLLLSLQHVRAAVRVYHLIGS